MKTTLITAAGSASADCAMQSLRAHGHRVVACDTHPRSWNTASMEADAFFQSIYTTDRDAYLRLMKEAVRREQIDFLIPLTDVEVDVLCVEKARFAALGCTVCTPDEPSVRLCRHKMNMARAIDEAALCRTIPTVSPYGREPREDEFPVMLKPLHGRSSQGQVVVRTPEAYTAALAQRDDFIAQPFLEGDIYTVDVARDLYGSSQCVVRRELMRTVNGLGTTVRILPDHPLEAVCARIAEMAGLLGVVNMEFIGCGEDFYFLEVNPRFSGGIGFTHRAGVDFPWLEMLCHEGEPIGPRPALHSMTLTRRIEPVITEE